jgi:hypothetical protein
MTAPATFTTISVVPASSEKVRAQIVTPAGVNDEFVSLSRYDRPADTARTIDPANSASLRAGPQLASAARRLADLTIAELEPGRRFVERSSMLSIEHWRHERLLTAVATGCDVHDRIRFAAPPAAGVAARDARAWSRRSGAASPIAIAACAAGLRLCERACAAGLKRRFTCLHVAWRFRWLRR